MIYAWIVFGFTWNFGMKFMFLSKLLWNVNKPWPVFNLHIIQYIRTTQPGVHFTNMV